MLLSRGIIVLKVRYCSKCVLPNTRPQLIFNYDTLTCDACSSGVNKKKIDWSKRNQLFKDLVKEVKSKKKNMTALFLLVVVRIVPGK